jgi:hypothetical protein
VRFGHWNSRFAGLVSTADTDTREGEYHVLNCLRKEKRSILYFLARSNDDDAVKKVK